MGEMEKAARGGGLKNHLYRGILSVGKARWDNMSEQKAPGGDATSAGGFLRTYAATPDRAWLPCD